MKCWECKKEIQRAIRVNYSDGCREKARNVCPECEKKLVYNPCHFVEVERITRGQLSRHNIGNLSAKELAYKVKVLEKQNKELKEQLSKAYLEMSYNKGG